MFRRALSLVLLVGLVWLGDLPAASGADAPPPAAPTVLRAMAGLPRDVPGRSLPVRAPVPFSLLGLRAPAGAELLVRTSPDGDRWGPWAHVEQLPPDEGPDPGSAEPAVPARGLVPSAPVWTGPARWLQVRVTGAEPGQVRPIVIDTLGQGRSLPERAWDALRASWSPRRAEAVVDRPRIVSRAEWGADERLRDDEPSVARRVRAAFVHHTVNANAYTQAEAPALIRGIYRYHTQSLGWNDIGYNLLVDRFGTIYEGRAGGLERPVIGAHAGGFNTSTFGVASLGTHTGEGPTAAALEGIARAIAWKFDVHHVDVTSAVDLTSRGSTRYADGKVVRLPTVTGHRSVSQTSCPGNALDALLPAIRHRVLELGGSMILDHDAAPNRVTVARGRALEGPVRFSARLRPEGEWSLEVRGPAGTVVHRDSGQGDTVASAWQPAPGSPLGRYHWTLSSPGRRDAEEWVDLVPPVIREPSLEGAPARGGQEGGFAQPVRFAAELWPQAVWTLTVTAPDGTPAHVASGVGERLETSWSGRAGLPPGSYGWRIEADDAEPVRGELEVLWPVLERAGAAGDGPGRAITLSRTAFPSSGSARHAVLARADVFADAMAGGPLAGEDGPVLLNPGDRLDARVRAELERVLPAGRTVYLLGGERALAPAVAEALDGRWDVVRLSGAGREETAARIAEVVLERDDDVRRVLVARAGPDSASPWADALAGGAYGAAEGIPVLLTDSRRLAPAARELIRRHDIREAVVLGGAGAVSDAVLADLPSPKRVQGRDRAGTAAAVAEQLWRRVSGSAGDRVLVGNGYAADAWTFALAASPLAARNDAPLLLVDRDSVPPATREHLDRLGYAPQRVAEGWVLGGPDSVGQAVADDVARRLQ